jgi:glycosyltransferase involved in cell wall biosynthesis
MKIPISVLVSVKNEEKNLPPCLSCLDSFDEVIVVDSGSTDRTPEIAKEFGYSLIDFKWDGKFPKKRNWALRNLSFRNDWVLFLDADEQVSQEFAKEIKSKIENSEYSGFWLTYDNFFMGKKLRFGDKMRKLALFKKGAGEYECIFEDSWSHLDMEVHEHAVITGKVGVIKSPINHNDYKGLEKYIDRHNAYSTWEAKRYLQLQKDKNVSLTFRQKLKYGLLETGLLPFIYFIGAYFLKLGFLDGVEGYYLAQYKKQYFFQIQTKFKELKR